MSTTDLIAFIVAVALTYVIPGPDFAIILRYASRGRRLGRLAASGVLVGMCFHLAAAAVGLSALLARSATAFGIVKVIGAGYLLYLGLRTLWSARKRNVSSPPPESELNADVVENGSTGRVFFQGVLTNVLNPKTALFFLSLIPQFIDYSNPVLPQTVLLGVLTVGFGLAWWMAFVSLADLIRGFLARPQVRRAFDSTIGIVFVALGVRLLRTPGSTAL